MDEIDVQKLRGIELEIVSLKKKIDICKLKRKLIEIKYIINGENFKNNIKVLSRLMVEIICKFNKELLKNINYNYTYYRHHTDCYKEFVSDDVIKYLGDINEDIKSIFCQILFDSIGKRELNNDLFLKNKILADFYESFCEESEKMIKDRKRLDEFIKYVYTKNCIQSY